MSFRRFSWSRSMAVQLAVCGLGQVADAESVRFCV